MANISFTANRFAAKLSPELRRTALAMYLQGVNAVILAELLGVSLCTMRGLTNMRHPAYLDVKAEYREVGLAPFILRYQDQALMDEADRIGERRYAAYRAKMKAIRAKQIEAKKAQWKVTHPASAPYRRADHSLDYELIPPEILADPFAMWDIETGEEKAIRTILKRR